MDEEVDRICEALRAAHLFSDVLRPDQLDALARECALVTFLKGSLLIRQGDIGTSMFCIVAGSVSIVHVDKSRRTNAIRDIGAGSVVGEIELLTGEQRVATVKAATDVEALEIPKQALDAAFARSPDLIESFAAILALRRNLLEQIVPQQRASLRRRVAGQIRGAFARHGGDVDESRR